MTIPGTGAVPVGDEDIVVAARVHPFGHPRRGLRAIPRFPLSTSDVEALRVAFGPGSSAHPLSVSGTYPVPEGGIPPIGSPA